ncbi:MAG: polysaccharide deacetylase family protein [Candidatus Zixiibacteriota bacterium]|nr:MAG: polysaccharide deacetylase family protein [candidate division Zixibacteria bacterium]
MLIVKRLAEGSLLILFVLATVSPGQTQTNGSRDRQAKNKEISITFDELPVARGFGEVDREAVTYLLLDALKRGQVRATGFVVGQEIGDSYDILGQWLNGGHALGSMTFTNQDYNYIGIEQFIEDIQRGTEAMEPMLAGFGQKQRYFRYPFLHYGTEETSRRVVATYLEDIGAIVAPATIVPEDYLYNLTLEKLGKEPDSVAFVSLMNEYINHVLDEVERVEHLALEIENRPIRQILLLRANRLNAVYLDDLLKALKEAGYSFVTLDRALRDRVYSRPDFYYGLKGLGFLDRIIQSDPDFLPAE